MNLISIFVEYCGDFVECGTYSGGTYSGGAYSGCNEPWHEKK